MTFFPHCWLVRTSASDSVTQDQEVGKHASNNCFAVPLANLENLTRWVSLREFILHGFPQSPWGCSIKREGGGLINAGPPEAFSLKAFPRQQQNVCMPPSTRTVCMFPVQEELTLCMKTWGSLWIWWARCLWCPEGLHSYPNKFIPLFN